ncbi:hypothetical protein ACJX0J_010432, partial [Zea mays]
MPLIDLIISFFIRDPEVKRSKCAARAYSDFNHINPALHSKQIPCMAPCCYAMCFSVAKMRANIPTQNKPSTLLFSRCLFHHTFESQIHCYVNQQRTLPIDLDVSGTRTINLLEETYNYYLIWF